MSLSPFDRPIPGQSLTAEPGNAPWEKPSKFSDPLDALEMYIERLADDEVLNDVIDLIDAGAPLDSISGAMLSTGVLRGMHTVDVKILLRPLLTAHINSLAEAIGIDDYKITFDDYKDEKEEEALKLKNRIKAKLDKIKGPPDEGEKIMKKVEQSISTEGEVQEAVPAEGAMQEAVPTQEEPKGLMAKEQ